MEPLDSQDVEELIQLVVDATAKTMMDDILIEAGITSRIIYLKQLEMKLIRLRSGI